MTASLPFVPPAPMVHPKILPVWSLLWEGMRSSLSIWPDFAFDALTVRNSVMGLKTLLVNDPDGARHVLTANAANYRRPPIITRFARPFGGSGLFLAEGADWRRKRRLLAPTFTPGGVGQLLPHFRNAGLHLLLSLEKSPRANLSKAFQDTALEAVLRALFSMPESGDRQMLSHMLREYADGPGRPNVLDALRRAKTPSPSQTGNARAFRSAGSQRSTRSSRNARRRRQRRAIAISSISC